MIFIALDIVTLVAVFSVDIPSVCEPEPVFSVFMYSGLTRARHLLHHLTIGL